MSGGPADIFRARILRIVVDVSPCMPYRVADPTALMALCESLVEAEEARMILRALGYGKSWNSIVELAQMVPHSTTMLIRPEK